MITESNARPRPPDRCSIEIREVGRGQNGWGLCFGLMYAPAADGAARPPAQAINCMWGYVMKTGRKFPPSNDGVAKDFVYGEPWSLGSKVGFARISRFGRLLIRCIPDSLRGSVPLILKRQCDRTLRSPQSTTPTPARWAFCWTDGRRQAPAPGHLICDSSYKTNRGAWK
jgi:hypothetical protein